MQTVSLPNIDRADLRRKRKWRKRNESSEDAAAKFKKGDEITAVVLQVDADRERISLGVKQLEEDPFSRYAGDPAKKGKVVTGTVKSVDARGAVIELEEGVEGYIRASDAARDRVEDATTVFAVGDQVEAKFVSVDRKNHQIILSVRAKDEAEEKAAIENLNKTNANFETTNAMAEAFKAAKA